MFFLHPEHSIFEKREAAENKKREFLKVRNISIFRIRMSGKITVTRCIVLEGRVAGWGGEIKSKTDYDRGVRHGESFLTLIDNFVSTDCKRIGAEINCFTSLGVMQQKFINVSF